MEPVIPDFKGENKGHYTPGMKAGNLLFISGQLSIDPDTRIVPAGDIKEHARLALNNLDRVLQAAGCTREQVAMCSVSVVGMENWGPVNEVYAEFFGAHKPARTITPVTELHFGCLVEISAVAELQ